MDMKYTEPNIFNSINTQPQYKSEIPVKITSFSAKPISAGSKPPVKHAASAAVLSEKNIPKQSDAVAYIPEQSAKSKDSSPEDGLYGRGLLNYERWWKFREIDVSVSGTLLSGTPAFIEKNTLRIINNEYSYFVPLEKVDYIRTKDSLL